VPAHAALTRKADAMKILLPVDGSPLALEAVRHAIRLVRDGLQADFVLANVQEPSSLYEVMVLHDADALRRMAREAGEDAIAAADRLLCDAGIDHEIEVGTGDPAHALIDIAERYQCNAIIMGAHGIGESGSALGTVAQSVLRSAPIPVMIVRPHDPESAEPGAQAMSADSTL
jgi:nucleotide-binding universal stress UspA family protein